MSLKVVRDESAGCVSLCMNCNDTLSAFMDVYVDDGDSPSPFRTLDDVEDFVNIIKKLLETVHDFGDKR